MVKEVKFRKKSCRNLDNLRVKCHNSPHFHKFCLRFLFIYAFFVGAYKHWLFIFEEFESGLVFSYYNFVILNHLFFIKSKFLKVFEIISNCPLTSIKWTDRLPLFSTIEQKEKNPVESTVKLHKELHNKKRTTSKNEWIKMSSNQSTKNAK